MTFIDKIGFPFKFFVSLFDSLLDIDMFWAVIVALIGCASSYLFQICFRRKKYG